MKIDRDAREAQPKPAGASRFRRALLLGTLGGLVARAGATSIGAQGRPVELLVSEPLQRIHAGGPTGLLGIGASGDLWALDLSAGTPRRLARDLDAEAPLATGEGRIAAHTRQGALWVSELGKVSVSRAGVLAPHAGLLNLPFAVIGVGPSGQGHRLLRMEAGAQGWSEADRSAVDVLPDARPLQVDLDGRGDGGHLVVFGGPDDQRYRHGVLGDGVEATRLLWLDRHDLGVLREHVLLPPFAFEDIAPRPVFFDGRAGLLTVRSGPGGAQLALLAADPDRPTQIALAALGDDLGGPRRWMAPGTDGRRIVAVHTPHVGGVLHAYRLAAGRLERRPIVGDVSTHRIGTRELDLSAWFGSRLVLPSQDGMRLRVLDAAADWAEREPIALPAPVAMTVRLSDPDRLAILMSNGRVATAAL